MGLVLCNNAGMDLVQLAKSVAHMDSPEMRERQIRSFAYGNAAMENPMVTMALIDELSGCASEGQESTVSSPPTP